ncbi:MULTISPECIES: LysR substrate-binding domain-containing protein [unclassified Shinella]|uniref:LysR substrate-binding domain-containing protein n=1 Tax=unclassified Shinella TaxID=2643062 RepID=UPI00225CAA43|nr:LysR substrate-binding domain-containing protein [Shinella sp. YE25]MDC7259459.1 LysR family transcriptional regulator [Shinella sp. YE25]CAI0341214.1 LysR family transcriptional regulator [Rhizobiaceae bacterium]CAK7260856.1 LysR family transcriptional regulator, glycine cleavage system transcriptional activator [Shinella sp. WSC3-e]
MDHTLPPLEAFQAVLAASSTGSLTAAAESLDVTHGAISRRVSVVERWSGIRIFTRHGRGVIPTPAGQRLIAQIDYLLAQLEDAPLSGSLCSEVEVVRVGTVQSFARLWLLPNLARLEGEPPDLRVELEIDNRLMALSTTRVAVRLGRGDWPGVSAIRLFPETLRPVARRETIAQLGDQIRPQDLLTQPLLHDASDSAWRHWLGMDTLGSRPRDRILPGYDLALIAAGAGQGIALARWPYGRHYIENLGLSFLSTHTVPNPSAFHLVTPGRGNSLAVNRLTERMLALAADELLEAAV